MGMGLETWRKGLDSSPDVQGVPPSPGVWDHRGQLTDCPSLPFYPCKLGGGRVLGSEGWVAASSEAPTELRLGGHGLLGLIPVPAGLLELLPQYHLSFQILQVFLAE